MRKILLIAGALLTFSFATAKAAPYIAGSVGIDTTTSSNSNFRGATLAVAGGYGKTFNQSFYLAGEIFGNLGTITINNNSAATNMHTTYSYGASIIPGFFLSEHSMAFARAGLIETRFTSMDSTQSGAEIGLGIQTGITQNLDLRGEYDYVAYRKLSGVSPQSDQFNLGLVYRFE